MITANSVGRQAKLKENRPCVGGVGTTTNYNDREHVHG
jgi:hypothetical protein